MMLSLHFAERRPGYNEAGGKIRGSAYSSSFGNPCQLSKSTGVSRKIFGADGNGSGRDAMDKLAGLKEILSMDPKNSFARYGLAMELSGRGETDAAVAEFTTLVENDPDYTAGYFMAAQTLEKAGRAPAAIERLHAGIASARRTGNNHALSEMQAMLDELDR
jgi:thioredoxin-like negative regulator of GroEL